MIYLRRLPANQPRIHPSHWIMFFSLVGFGLRLHRLNFQPLWGDEGWSFYFAMQPVPRLLALTAIDIHPPFYYLLLKGWLSVAGYGPETARFLSILIGTLLIPVVGVLGRRLFEARVGAIAAGVVAVMPLAIYYAQEVRMYGLVTLLGAMSVYCLLRAGVLDGQLAAYRNRWLMAYVVTTTAALYTMYYAAFIPLFQLLFMVITSLRRRAPLLRRANAWLVTPFVYVGLLYCPWLIYAGPRLANYIDNKQAVERYVPLDVTDFMADHLVAFSLGHLPPVLQPYRSVAILFVAVAVAGLLIAFYLSWRRALYPALYLFLPLGLGYVVNRFYPFTPRYFERTLLLVAPAYWLFIAAGLLWLWQRQYLVSGLVASAMLLVTSVSLIGFYSAPRYADEDYRPLLADIAARATPQDTILASYQWQLGFYQAYLPPPRPRFYSVPGWGQAWAGPAGQPRLTRDLNDIFAHSPRLWFPAYQAEGHFWEDEAEAAIVAVGYPALLQWHGPKTKLTLAAPPEPNLLEVPPANFDNQLVLLKAGLGQGHYEAGRGIVPVQLTWQKDADLDREYLVSLRLVDAAGRTWATRDSYPRAGQIRFSQVDTGDILHDRHGLLVPAGTPPGQYELRLSLRRVGDAHPLDLRDAAGQPVGVEHGLGQIDVIAPDPPVGPAALPVQVPNGAEFDRTVRLVGYSLGDGPFKAGQMLPLNLFWQSLTDNAGSLTVFVHLLDASGQPVVQHEQPPIWPATAWGRGTLLRDPHDVVLPPTLPPGDYGLVVGLVTPEQTRLKVTGDDQLLLTSVMTIDRPHVFEAPEPERPLAVTFGDRAELIGLDLATTEVKAGEPLPLTLYWQALAPFDKSWTVFVHLTDREGHIVGQQDQIPGGGQFPTTSWLPNEFLVDTYTIHVPLDTPPGDETYMLEIGLYDAAASDFARLPVTAPSEAINDHVVLDRWPITIK